MSSRKNKAPPEPMDKRVFQRGKVWWIRYWHNGRKIQESSRSLDVSKANALLKRRLAEMEVGQFVGPDVNRTTFDDLVKMIRDDYKLNGRKSADRVEIAIKQLRDIFGFEKARNITADRIAAYTAQRLEDGAARATIRYELAVLRRMFRLAAQSEKVSRVPHIPAMAVDNARQGFFEVGDLDAVLEKLDEPLRAFIRFLYLTGWRAGEAASLTWASVDLDAGIVRLEPGTTKNGEGRTFPFRSHPALAELLKAQREYTKAVERDKGRIVSHVFHRNGDPIRSYAKAWNAACDAAGQKGRLVHDLRRTAVRNLERAGVPRSQAMKLTGHKTEAVYRRYAIVSEADLAEAVAKVAKFEQTQATGGRTVLTFPTGTKPAQSPDAASSKTIQGVA